MWVSVFNTGASSFGNISISIAATGLLCALSLSSSEPKRPGRVLGYARRFANLLLAAAVVYLVVHALHGTAGLDGLFNAGRAAVTPGRVSAAFAVLAITVIVIQSSNSILNRIADGLVCLLCLLVAILLSDFVFAASHLIDGPSPALVSPLTLACLTLLTTVVVLSQAGHGIFAIFLGVGIGSKLARILAPILIALPFLREVIVARLSTASTLSSYTVPAILTSVSALFLVGVLLFFTWRISRMENEIHDLILRDELTRLYNFRGFHLLAEHALRLAQRSNLPFSVLFIDFENLKQINAELGSNATAAYLVEAGEVIRTTFRESDIKGRIGGEEFAVAGQFDHVGISVAALRLEAASAARTDGGRRPSMKFSMGHVTSEKNSQESLKDLLARADKVRFQERRQMDKRVN
jgi:diguanylate cyclase (GGDEF)-like protein